MMYSAGAIAYLEREAGARAAVEGVEPGMVNTRMLTQWVQEGVRNFPFPFIGQYVPPGWQRTDRAPLFVDTTGLGGDNEPALSVSQLVRELRAGYGYALIQIGQFQGYLGEYRRDEHSAGKPASGNMDYCPCCRDTRLVEDGECGWCGETIEPEEHKT